MITVSVIAIITAIILTMVTLVDDAMQQSGKIQELNQEQLILNNVQSALKKIGSQLTSAEALDMILLAPIMFSDDEGAFTLSLTMQSQQAKLNLNAMLDTNSSAERTPPIRTNYYDFLFNLFNLKGLSAPDQMIALLADTIDGDDQERLPDSEVIVHQSDFANGAIHRFSTLKKLSDQYYQSSRDANIYKINWSDYFYLGSPDENLTLDCNYLSWDMADALNLKVDATKGLELISCDNLARDQNETLSRYNIAPFTKGMAHYHLFLRADYTIEGKNGGFSADYDLQTERISNIKSIKSF